MKRSQIEVNDLMQRGYVYRLTEPVGKNFQPDFRPQLVFELGFTQPPAT